MSAPLIVLRPDDAPQMATVHAQSFDKPWPPRTFRYQLREPAYFGLGIENEDGNLLGFVLCQIAVDEADVLTLAVSPDARRRGHARTLLRALLKRLGERGIARLMLDVAADNEAAVALYQTMGFTEDGRRKDYIKRKTGRIDAVLMSRPVTGLPGPEKA